MRRIKDEGKRMNARKTTFILHSFIAILCLGTVLNRMVRGNIVAKIDAGDWNDERTAEAYGRSPTSRS